MVGAWDSLGMKTGNEADRRRLTDWTCPLSPLAGKSEFDAIVFYGNCCPLSSLLFPLLTAMLIQSERIQKALENLFFPFSEKIVRLRVHKTGTNWVFCELTKDTRAEERL